MPGFYSVSQPAILRGTSRTSGYIAARNSNPIPRKSLRTANHARPSMRRMAHSDTGSAQTDTNGTGFLKTISSTLLDSIRTELVSTQGANPALALAVAQNEAEERAGVAEAKLRLAEMGMNVPSLWTQPVCWGDSDSFRHTNNVHYLRWLESARMKFLSVMGSRLPEQQARNILQGKGKSFILAGASLRYIRPVVYPDTCVVGTKLVEINAKRTRATLQAVVYSVAQQATVLTSDQVFVSYDYDTLKSAPMDPTVDALIEQMLQEGQAASHSIA